MKYKNMRILKNLFICLIFSMTMSGCYEDMDDVIRPASELEIKNFIWRAMNDMYLYKADVPELADSRFETQQELNEYLQTFSSPEALFQALLSDEDRFSVLTSDYRALEKALDGIRLSNGMQYGLIRYTEGSSEVLGYVRYVLPGTSAERQGLKRGDLFNTVDGQQLTVENFPRLLDPVSYTIGLAQIEGDVISSTGETVNLQKEEYTTNPIGLAKVIETENAKVGYLLYNAFTSTFDGVLNDAFAMFKAEGVTDLVVDLRYNGGGSVETASDLASMITGQFKGEIFYTREYNEDYQTFFETTDPERLVSRFNAEINTGAAINSLGLSKVYVITTARTASASELLINSLEPYIDVVQVGENTTGKFQASTTLYDSPDLRRSGASLGHTYAIQPLIYKTLNASGVTDYVNGLPPDIEISENVRNLGELGAIDEPLLRAALNDILGIPQNFDQNAFSPEVIGESGMKEVLYQRMYTEDNFVKEIKINMN